MCDRSKVFSLILFVFMWSNVFAIELFYLKGSDELDADSFGNKYAFVLNGRSEDYGFIIKCSNPKQEKDVLSGLFNNPRPAVDKKHQFTYRDFESVKKMNAKTFIKLCPFDENTNGINLFRDGSVYYLHFYDAFDEFLYLTVKSKKVLKSFGLDFNSAKRVPQSDFRKFDIALLDDSIEATNYHIDSVNKNINVYVDSDSTFKADIVVTVHIKGKIKKNERSENLDISRDQYIFDSTFYMCTSNSDGSDDSNCELKIPFGTMIKKLNRELGDEFEVDEIEDVLFENITPIDRKEAARIFKVQRLQKEKQDKANADEEQAKQDGVNAKKAQDAIDAKKAQNVIDAKKAQDVIDAKKAQDEKNKEKRQAKINADLIASRGNNGLWTSGKYYVPSKMNFNHLVIDGDVTIENKDNPNKSIEIQCKKIESNSSSVLRFRDLSISTDDGLSFFGQLVGDNIKVVGRWHGFN